MLKRLFLSIAISAALCLAATSVQGSSSEAWYIVMERSASGDLREVSRHVVPLVVESREIDHLQPLRHDEVRATLFDSTGRPVFTDLVVVRTLRGEFHGRNGIDAVFPEGGDGTAWFVLRVPAVAGVMRLEDGGGLRSVLSLDPDLSSRRASTITSPVRVSSVGVTGPSTNRVDILVVGEGYTAAEEQEFEDDVARFSGGFFAQAPYAEYRPFVNLRTLFVASPESGADQPPFRAGCTGPSCCPDSEASRASNGRFVDTVFDARFCTAGVWRLLSVDVGKVFGAAAAVPDWDQVIVLVNDPEYGGSGGSVAVVSVDERSGEIAVHEYGHSFTGLADEYSASYPGYPGCSDLVHAGCEPNVTDESVPALIKWAEWIDSSTPIPTPEAAEWGEVIGLFEGARYQQRGMFRPQANCNMRSLGESFCSVCTAAFVERLYAGRPRVPAPVRLIEPGSPTPAVASLAVERGSEVAFSATVLQTARGSVTTRWLVDEIEMAEGAAFAWRPEMPGRYVVELVARDTNPLLPPSRAGLAEARHRWVVTVRSDAPPRRGARPPVMPEGEQR